MDSVLVSSSLVTARYYYAPNTYKQLKIAQLRKDGHTVSEEDAHAPFTLPVSQHATCSAVRRTGCRPHE